MPDRGLKVCKTSLRKAQTVADAVAEAQAWANDLVLREARGPGDFEPAMRRIAGKIGVGYAKLWALRYRPPKDVGVNFYRRLQAAWAAERERQLRLLIDDIARTKSAAGANPAAVRAAEALVGEALGTAETMT
jgi:hypothetical protein